LHEPLFGEARAKIEKLNDQERERAAGNEPSDVQG
jgi:hypothetical protein